MRAGPGGRRTRIRPLDYLDLKRGYDEVLDWLDAVLARIRVGYRCLPFQGLEQGFAIQLPDARSPASAW